MRNVLLVSLCYFLCSCVVGPHYLRPKTPLPKPFAAQKTVETDTRFGHAQELAIQHRIPKQWWTLFHSKQLNALIEASFKNNPSVSSAQATLHSALETVYVQQSALFPFVTAQFSPSKQEVAKILTSVLASNQYSYALYTGQVLVAYTPDVFGGIQRSIESSIAQANYQRFELEATYLTLAANVVLAAIQEASWREQIRTTELIVALQHQYVNIIQARIALGDASEGDSAIQEASLAAIEATLPTLQKQLAMQHDLLNALTGRLPNDPNTPPITFDQLQLPDELPLILPAQLLEQRPDIRAAEELMRAANARIGVAVSNRLPNFSLNFTNAGTSATTLETLFNGKTVFWSLMGIIAQPVFDAGKLSHAQRVAELNYQAAAADYKSTVIHAFQNVADTLNAIRLDAQALSAVNHAAAAAKKSYFIAHQKYTRGDASILYEIFNQEALYQSELNLIQAQTNRLTDSVALLQALGGGWRPSKTTACSVKNKT